MRLALAVVALSAVITISACGKQAGSSREADEAMADTNVASANANAALARGVNAMAAYQEPTPPGASEAQKAMAAMHGDLLAVGLGGVMIRSDPSLCATANPSARLLMQEMQPYQSPMQSEVTDAYAETFTPAELSALTKFYSTPEGKIIAAKTAMLDARLSAIGASYLVAATTGGPARLPPLPCHPH